MSWNHLINFRGPGYSGPLHLNLLAQWKNIYLMDNHMMALWCWAHQTASPNSSSCYNLFHLDAHYDADPILLENFPPLSWPQLGALTVEQYRQIPNIAWDNYLPIMGQRFGHLLETSIGCTHHIGKAFPFTREIAVWDLMRDLDRLLVQAPAPWIVNLDLDFFFARGLKQTPLFHPDWMKRFWELIAMNWDSGKIAVLTIALSPECCGGWERAIRMWELGRECLDLPPLTLSSPP